MRAFVAGSMCRKGALLPATHVMVGNFVKSRKDILLVRYCNVCASLKLCNFDENEKFLHIYDTLCTIIVQAVW